MKKLFPFVFLALTGVASAEWRLNPYTQRQDYYESKAAVIISTGALQTEINALHVTTTTLTQDLATEVSRATVREDAIAVSTGVNAAAIDALELSTAPLEYYANWNTAYGWGNHASAGYLTAETDPVYSASSWFTTTNNSSNWDTAYGWGDHASAGYLNSSSNLDASKLVGGVPPASVDLSTVTSHIDTKVAKSGGTLTGNLIVGASVQANIFQSADPATVHQIWVASAVYAVNGGTVGGVATSTAVIDGSPIGSIIAHSTTTPPSGYLYCDGSSISTTTYAALFAVTGYRYGGTGANFNVPDMRGMFMRGARGDLNGRDPDANRVVGSTQTDTFQGHYHNFWSQATNGAGGVNGAVRTSTFGDMNLTNVVTAPISDGTNGTPRTSVETRPENLAVAYMIKYQHTGSVDISSTSLVAVSTLTWTGAQNYIGSVTVSSLTATGNVTFSGATSTTTISGRVDFGGVWVSGAFNAQTNCYQACPAGTRPISGSCRNSNADGAYSCPSTGIGGLCTTTNPTGWECSSLNNTNTIIFVYCARTTQ